MDLLLLMTESEKVCVSHYKVLSPLLAFCFTQCLASNIPHSEWFDYLTLIVFPPPPTAPVFDVTSYTSLFHQFRLMTGAVRKPYSAVGDQLLNRRASILGRPNPSRTFILDAMAPLGLNHHLSWMNTEKQADVHEACLGALPFEQQQLCLAQFYKI
jgi:hypothetical protein